MSGFNPGAAAASVRDALSASVDALSAAGVDTPRLDADVMLEAATGWDRARLAAHPEAGVDPPAARTFGAMVRRRLAREPVAYILGRKAFRHIELEVDRRVLIPRPETELPVEIAVELGPESVLDVGTGSGAVALAVAAELPCARVTATDTSQAALDLARANAERLGLADRVTFARGTLPPGHRFDVVLANLPYVREDEWDSLAPEITRFEPREALVAGSDGLGAIRELIAEMARRGPAEVCDAVALEVGAGQAGAVADLLSRSGFRDVEVRDDLAGIARVVVGSTEPR